MQNSNQSIIDLKNRKIELLKAKEYILARENFSNYVKVNYREYHNRDFIWNWHYDKMCKSLQDLYEGKFKLLILNVPPQSGKTEIVTKMFPNWCIGKSEFFNTIATGYSSSLTSTFSEQARNYYLSEAYKNIFPNRKELTKEGAETWGNDSGVYRSAGVGGSITGKGCDLFLIDDPLNPTDVSISNVSIDKVNTWFSNVARTRLSPIGKQLMVIIMQRLHDNDLTGYVLRRFKDRFDSGEWRHIEIDAERDKFGAKGTFFKELFPVEKLEKIRDEMTTERGSNFYAAQYRQNPLDVDKSEFKREYFNYYKETDNLNFTKGYIALDPAISERREADNSAIVAVATDKEGRYYRRAAFKGRVNPDIVIDEIFKMQSAFKYPVVIESVGFQRILAENIRKEMIRRNQMFSLIEIKSRSEKEARIRSTLQPLYAGYRVFHREEDRNGDFEEELIRFPKGTHDDEIDAFETAISQFSVSYKPEVSMAELESLREKAMRW